MCRKTSLSRSFLNRRSHLNGAVNDSRLALIARGYDNQALRRAASTFGMANLLTALPAAAAAAEAEALSSSFVDSTSLLFAAGGAIIGAGSVALLQHSRSTATMETSQSSSSNATSSSAAAAAAAQVDETEIESWREKEKNLKEEILHLTEQLSQAKAAQAVHATTVQGLKQKINSLEQSLSSKDTTVEEAVERAANADERLQRAIAETSQAGAAATELEAVLQQALEESASKDTELINGRKERESLKFKVIDAERKSEEANARSAAATAKLEQAEADVTAAQQEVSAKQAALDRAIMERTAVEHELASRDKQLQASFGDQNALLSRLENINAEKAELETALEAVQEDATAAKSLVTMEREKMEIIDAARAAAVQDARNLLAERRDLQAKIQETADSGAATVAEERLGRMAAEKALESCETQVNHLAEELAAATDESAQLRVALDEERKKIAAFEIDIQLASKDVKDSLHREMEALSEAQRQSEAVESLRRELASVKKASAAVPPPTPEIGETVSEVEPPKKRRGRPKKSGSDVFEQPIIDVYVGDGDGSSLTEEEMTRRVTQADADVAAARMAAEEAQQRAFEIRAEAALLVETVEDRAVEAVEAAQAEVARLKALLKKASG